MDCLIDFLRRNWKWLLPCICTFVSFIVLLFKKKVKIKDVFSMVLMKLPSFINLAEEAASSGEEKFSFVFTACLSLLCDALGCSMAEAESKYGALVTNAIEEILSTPQKKGE